MRPRRRPRKTPARSGSGPADGSRARQGRDDFGSEPKYPSCRSRSVPGRRLDALENSSAKSNVTRCTRFARVLFSRRQRRQQIRPQQRRTTARAPHRSPFPHLTSHEQARRITMRVHAGRRLPTPQMISNKLLTALALLAQHAAALDGVSGTTSRRLDDLCAPASTSAARRARRAARVPPSHVGLRRPRRRPRPRRRRPRRPCRAGAPPAFLNSTSPSKTPLQALEQVWSRQRCASAALRPTSGPDNATALGRGPCDARLARGLPRRANQHMAAHEQQA